MASIALQPTTVPPGPRRPSRPPLRVLPGGRSPAHLAQRARYRRRRLVAAIVLVALVVAVVLLASAALSRIAGGAPSAAGAPSSPAATSSVVVEPGDTLWSIASAIAPDVDVRVTVDRLAALNGSAPLVEGQELVLP